MEGRDPLEVQDLYNNFLRNIQEPPMRNQNNFQLLAEDTSEEDYELNKNNLEEVYLPNYVVPVLYIPQRIITSDELYTSELYDKNPIGEEVRPKRYKSLQAPLNKPNTPPFLQSSSPHTHLTESEKNMYDELVQTLYGMERSEEEIAIADYNPSEYELPNDSAEQEKVIYHPSPRRRPISPKSSPYVPNFMMPSNPSYTVYPMNPIPHQPRSRIRDNTCEIVCASKCTQTTADISTETGDCNITYPTPIRSGRPKSQSLNCNHDDVTLVIHRGYKENVYTVLGTETEMKFDKGTELATVDLLPISSRTIQRITTPRQRCTSPRPRSPISFQKTNSTT